MKRSARDNFQAEGFVAIPNYISRSKVNSGMTKLAENEAYKKVIEKNVYTSAGKSSHEAIDSYDLRKIWPESKQIYKAVYSEMILAFYPSAQVSPYERAAFYIKKYVPPDGEQGWHYDTNCLSGILYLTNNDNGETEIITECNNRVKVFPRAGKLLVIKGGTIWHRAAPVKSHDKITMIMNFYLPGYEKRPDWIDSKIFGRL